MAAARGARGSYGGGGGRRRGALRFIYRYISTSIGSSHCSCNAYILETSKSKVSLVGHICE